MVNFGYRTVKDAWSSWSALVRGVGLGGRLQLPVHPGHHHQLVDCVLCGKEQVPALQLQLCGGGSLTEVSFV